MELKYTEVPHRRFLNRDNARADVQRAYSCQLRMLRDMIDYGTNLIPRAFTSSEKKLEDVVVIGTLLRQMVEMLDAFECLCGEGAVRPASLQARAIFEASIYIEWLLKEKTEERARYYHVHNLRRQKLWAERMIKGSADAQGFEAEWSNLDGFAFPDHSPEAVKTIASVDRVLARPELASINQHFNSLNKKQISWYQPLGPRNLGALARDLNRKGEHTLFYSLHSEAMHGSTYSGHVAFEGERVRFEPFRTFGSLKPLFMFTVSAVFNTYRRILLRYRPGEVQALCRKYLECWRQDFLTVPDIKYQVIDDGAYLSCGTSDSTSSALRAGRCWHNARTLSQGDLDVQPASSGED